MKYFITLFILTYGWTLTTSSNPEKIMENQVKQTIIDFTEAGEKRDLQTMETVLHPEFRVVLNRFRGAGNTSIMDRKTYLDMIESEKIGGEHYQLKIHNVSIHDHTAAARVEWKNDKTIFRIHFLLVKNAGDQWQIISDMPVVSGR